jgi:hypothetical protein
METDCIDYFLRFWWGSFYMLTALATPTIAFLVWRVGREQKEIAAQKLRLDLFEKKFAIYRAVSELVTAVTTGELSGRDLDKFSNATAAAVFLLSDRIVEYLREMRGHAFLIHVANNTATLEASVADHALIETRSSLFSKKEKAMKWFFGEIRGAAEIFKPEMTV